VLRVFVGWESVHGWVAQAEVSYGRVKDIIQFVDNNVDGDPKFLVAFQKEENCYW
jgi:hypothetical protein